MRAALIVAILALVGCEPSARKTPIAEGDEICIGVEKYVVKDISAYPWVHLGPQPKCVPPGTPTRYEDFSEIHSFAPNCVCKYSYACVQSCNGSVATEVTGQECLDACTN